MLCRQSNQKENRKVERRRRTHLRKFGTSILYKLHNDSGTNSEGQKCKIYARKHIEQVDREYTAGTIKFGKNAKICHFAMEKLRHMCMRMTKAKFDDKAELPEMDSKTVDEYLLEHYPIDLKEIDRTVEEQKEWVKKLQDGEFGHFSCFRSRYLLPEGR
eukprot:COSAG05_NODE_4_length_49189_cov_157.128784_22_plen_159_part_00